MTELVLAGLLVVAVVGLVLWRPEAAVMGLGVFLFVQSAIIRVEPLPSQLREVVARADEFVLATLVARTTALLIVQRRFRLPVALWPLGGFVAVGLISAVANSVNPVQASVGIYLAVKGGLWLFVGRFLHVDERAIVRYAYLIGALFLAAVMVAVAQFAGVTMPWESTVRHSGALAATSIWNQHTAFGSALAVGIGIAVAGARLPGERLGAAALAFTNLTGIILSSVRRLLLSLPLAGLCTLGFLPRQERAGLFDRLRVLRRPIPLALLVGAFLLAAALVGPRLVRIAADTWSQYVVDFQDRGRYQLYAGALQLLTDSPLFGRGPGTYGSYASVVFGSSVYGRLGIELPDTARMAAPYGSLLAEYGVAGALAFAGFLALIVRSLIPVARGLSGSLQAALAGAGIFMLLDLAIEAIVNPVFSNSFITFFVFVGIGVALALESKHRGSARPWDARTVSRRWRMGSIAAALLFTLLLIGLVAGLKQSYSASASASPAIAARATMSAGAGLLP